MHDIKELLQVTTAEIIANNDLKKLVQQMH